jgi:hypothetical protein
MTSTRLEPLAVPELGPLLGRLATPAAEMRSSLALDDIRYALVTELFELGAAAREFAAAGDLAAAATSLGRHGWLSAWERAVAALAERVASRLDVRMREAARESRMPAGRLAHSLLDDEERRAIRLRLGIAGGPFLTTLDLLEATVPGASRGPDGTARWREAVGMVARRIESAWLALVDAAESEEAAWSAEVERIRAWRRARWPLWLMTAAVVAVAIYFGLVFGGFVGTPKVLKPLADFWWSHL